MGRLLTDAAFGRLPAWTARALALFQTDDGRFTDEEILMILRTGEAGFDLTEVCAAARIPEATYYAWQARYSGRQPSDLRSLRRREHRKHRATMAACAALVVFSMGAAGMLIGIPNLSPPPPSAAANGPQTQLTSRPWAAAAAVAIPVVPPILESAAAAQRGPEASAVQLPAAAADAAQQPVAPSGRATAPTNDDIKTVEPIGYAVQVAAVPDLQEARAVLAQLADAGYSAYLIAKTINRVELYRVRVGPLKSRLIAEEVARRLEREGHRAPWVTK
jgi:putative transposase